MRVKLFSQGVTAPIQSLEDDINDFLESQRPHVTYVSMTSSDVERVASVWYEEPHHRTVEQTMTELEELVEEPGSEGNLARRAGEFIAARRALRLPSRRRRLARHIDAPRATRCASGKRRRRSGSRRG
jgi:hypothetical protein